MLELAAVKEKSAIKQAEEMGVQLVFEEEDEMEEDVETDGE